MNNDRINRVLAKMEEAHINGLLISDYISIKYLTNIFVYPGERFWALYLSVDGNHVLFGNKLFVFPDAGIKTVLTDDTDDTMSIVASHIGDEISIGVDKNLAARFLLPLMEKKADCHFEIGSDCVDDVRAQKDEIEKEKMRKASQINDECIELLVKEIKIGMTEKKAAATLVEIYAEHGCKPSFDPIVSFGANASDPHHMPDDTPLKDGDCIVIDVGCKYDGYCSDMTRTYFCGEANPKHLDIFNLVKSANELAEAKCKPGMRFSELDAVARDLIAAAGYGPNFTHRLGHSIGLEVHDKGDVSAANHAIIKEGMIFSIEPGVYLPGEFGVRIEDLVLVTADGCEILNHVDKGVKYIGK